jgi:hypothetical protein
VIEATEVGLECALDMEEDRFVEVDTTEPLDPLGLAQGPEAVSRLLEDSGVERSAPQVVHRDHFVGVDPLRRGVVEGGGDRLGEQDGIGQSREFRGLLQEVGLVQTPVGWMGHRHR